MIPEVQKKRNKLQKNKIKHDLDEIGKFVNNLNVSMLFSSMYFKKLNQYIFKTTDTAMLILIKEILASIAWKHRLGHTALDILGHLVNLTGAP